VPLTEQTHLILRFYPELTPFLNDDIPENDSSHTRVLLLGGSAITNSLCNLERLLAEKLSDCKKPLIIFSLARYAHNSADSRVKLELISNIKFDYIFLYHGINDTRANNCPASVFDEKYNHIEFYRDVNLLLKHKEINWLCSPYYLEWIFDKLMIATGCIDLIPREYFVAHPRLFQMEKEFPPAKNPEELQLFKKLTDLQSKIITPELKSANYTWLEMGKDIKSSKTYQKNINAVYRICCKNNSKLILTPFAAYLPLNYTLHRFLTDTLNYAEQRWPAELYGKPQWVMKGIRKHNEITRQFASSHPDVLYFNFPDSIGIGRTYFNDICHLAPAGCESLSNCISNEIRKDLYQP
jgi:hypothetical protein